MTQEEGFWLKEYYSDKVFTGVKTWIDEEWVNHQKREIEKLQAENEKLKEILAANGINIIYVNKQEEPIKPDFPPDRIERYG
jgi:TRAP-type C4-dicarboxylate transport system substrate-binding protein